jgi:hypothetical protein
MNQWENSFWFADWLAMAKGEMTFAEQLSLAA